MNQREIACLLYGVRLWARERFTASGDDPAGGDALALAIAEKAGVPLELMNSVAAEAAAFLGPMSSMIEADKGQ